MNKKILIPVFALVLLIGTVVAGVTLGISKEINLEEEYKIKIDAINENIIERGDIVCDDLSGVLDGDETCRQKMWKGNYRLGEVKVSVSECSSWDEVIDEEDNSDTTCSGYSKLSEGEIKELLIEAQEENLIQIAKIRLSPEDEEERTQIVDAGEITLIKKAIAIEK